MKKPFVLIVIFLCLLVFNSSCQQEPKVLSISPCALTLPNNYFYQHEGLTFRRSGSYFNFDDPAEGEGWAYAPVYLPNGAKVKKFVVYYTDNDDTEQATITVSLSCHNHTSGDILTMASVTSAGLPSSPDRRILEGNAVDNAQVKNDLNSYFLGIVFEESFPTLIFHGAKVIYE